jgi:DNA modification methylase
MRLLCSSNETKKVTVIQEDSPQYVTHHGDSVLELGKLMANSVDLILTDPPYNLGLFMQGRDSNLGALRENHFVAASWDNDLPEEWSLNMESLFDESFRLLKVGGAMVVFMAIIKVETLIGIAQKSGFYYKTTGIWHKKNPMPRNMNLHFINSTEAWVYLVKGKKTGTFNNGGIALHDHVETPIIGVAEKKFGKHPTQKPVKLMEHFVSLLSNPGEVVLDPFMGSGSTGVAAMNLDRKFIGIELDGDYYDLANRRFESLAGGKLFN